MSAIIARFPARGTIPLRGAEVSQRYMDRAQEAHDLLAGARTDLERTTLNDIAEIWMEMAEAAAPADEAAHASPARRSGPPS